MTNEIHAEFVEIKYIIMHKVVLCQRESLEVYCNSYCFICSCKFYD